MSPRRSLPLPDRPSTSRGRRRDHDAVLAPADFSNAPPLQQSGAAHEMTLTRPQRERAGQRAVRLLPCRGERSRVSFDPPSPDTSSNQSYGTRLRRLTPKFLLRTLGAVEVRVTGHSERPSLLSRMETCSRNGRGTGLRDHANAERTAGRNRGCDRSTRKRSAAASRAAAWCRI